MGKIKKDSVPAEGGTVNRKARILVVDDNPKNIQMLGNILFSQGYSVQMAQNGRLALTAVNRIAPDLILLDVMMPEMDGFETCRRLQADEATKHIPIIFLTAKTAERDILKGFTLGGVDYITKPFSSVVLLARVNTHLRLKFANEELQAKNMVLEETVVLRENVERINRHDLKGPLSGIITIPELLRRAQNLTEGQKDLLGTVKHCGYRMLEMINRSLDLYKMETKTYQLRPTDVELLSVSRRIIDEMKSAAKLKELSVDILLHGKPADKEDCFSVQGESLLCYSLFANLFKNALEASPKKGRITISLEQKEACFITVHNRGAVPEEIRERFFEKYTTAGKFDGTGVGTYSAKLMAETQGGGIHMQTSEETGTAVTVRLLHCSVRAKRSSPADAAL
ncbi:MAG: response regulator [Gammaproteobacteria bacterium]|nr:response regulator [Gammaproteobacteria bacterium]